MAQTPWPYKSNGGAATSPPALTQSPDGLLRSGRSLAGPLRNGTGPDVGPAARGFGAVVNRAATDFGRDSVSPRSFDPMGTSDTRAPAFPASERVRRG